MEAAGSGSGCAAAARGRGSSPCGYPARPLAPPRSSSAPPRRRQDWNPRERKAAEAFVRALLKCVNAYMDLTEEDIREEYRLAGKLDKYDPANDEMGMRIARVIKMYPPPPGGPPGCFSDTDINSLLKLVDDDEEEEEID